jgi:hypothetical protein
VYSKISKGVVGAAHNRGFKPLLRKKILLEFFHFCGINIVLIQSILRFINYIEFKKTFSLKKDF